jgi:hypothetical protein
MNISTLTPREALDNIDGIRNRITELDSRSITIRIEFNAAMQAIGKNEAQRIIPVSHTEWEEWRVNNDEHNMLYYLAKKINKRYQYCVNAKRRNELSLRDAHVVLGDAIQANDLHVALMEDVCD